MTVKGNPTAGLGIATKQYTDTAATTVPPLAAVTTTNNGQGITAAKGAAMSRAMMASSN
jgi:hypothetical protein